MQSRGMRSAQCSLRAEVQPSGRQYSLRASSPHRRRRPPFSAAPHLERLRKAAGDPSRPPSQHDPTSHPSQNIQHDPASSHPSQTILELLCLKTTLLATRFLHRRRFRMHPFRLPKALTSILSMHAPEIAEGKEEVGLGSTLKKADQFLCTFVAPLQKRTAVSFEKMRERGGLRWGGAPLQRATKGLEGYEPCMDLDPVLREHGAQL